MGLRKAFKHAVINLAPIFLVAVAVALGTTLASSAFTQVRQVDAEDINVAEAAASPAAAGTQMLTIQPWDVEITLPLVAGQSSLISYANQAGASVGLTSAELEKLGSGCTASHSALGSIIRYSHGHYSAGTGAINYFIGTVGDYDYSYRLPSGLCSNDPAAGSIINRETSVLNANLNSLAPVIP